jgi:glycosyltransferase involved in cell wall biosynthesis
LENLTIIICSFNEEKTICDVVSACRLYNENSEIIVVDDGSEDNTGPLLLELSKTVRFNYIKLPENKGKSYAMAVGIENASNDILLFFDADSTGIKREHFADILRPVMEDKADMVLGHTAATFINLKLTPFKAFTGERVLRKTDILPILEEIRTMRFGIETYINLHFQTHGKRISYVYLEGLRTLNKYEKTTLINATRQYFSEGHEIASTILKNYDMIFKVARSSLFNANDIMKKRLSQFQQNIVKKIQQKRDTIDA